MSLLPGFRLVVAPNFHIDVDWPKRLELGATVEETASGPVVRPPWRPASAEELATLVLPEPKATEEMSNCLRLFVLPVHLRTSFWNLVAQASAQGMIPPEEFAEFAVKVRDFLAFKELPLPDGASCEVVVNQQGSVRPLAASAVWGLINMGEDASALVFLNQPGIGVLASDNPPVRLLLAPGEGLQIPVGMPWACDCSDAAQPGIMLSIRQSDRVA